MTIGPILIQFGDLYAKGEVIERFVRKKDYSEDAIAQFIKDIDPEHVWVDLSAGLTYVFGESSLTKAGARIELPLDNLEDAVRAVLHKLGV